MQKKRHPQQAYLQLTHDTLSAVSNEEFSFQDEDARCSTGFRVLLQQLGGSSRYEHNRLDFIRFPGIFEWKMQYL